MNTPDKALFVLLIFFAVCFGITIIGMLIYFVMFVIELTTACHWIALPIGIIALVFLIVYALALQPK